MSALEEQWLQDIAESLGIPALSPTIVKMVLPVVEAHIKKIAQQAHKFQRRSKSTSMSVDDINSALSMNKLEPVYGLSRSEHVHIFTTPPTEADGAEKPAVKSAGNKKMINLVEFGKNSTIVPCPLKPEVTLHWLAVNGNQPLTADNPSVVTAEPEQQTMLLAKELQHLYARIVGIISSSSSSGPTVGLSAVLTVLRTDAGIQELAPYLSRCFYQQIRANSKRLVLLRTIIAAIRAMLGNPGVDLEFHLQQLMPALFTCVVAAKLSSSPNEDHWALRTAAAEAIATIGAKYSAQFPELHARMCKTYLEALGPDRSFGTLYGAIVGLSSLGNHTVRSLLLPNLPVIHQRLSGDSASNSAVVKAEGSGGQAASKRKRGASFDTASEKATSTEGTGVAQKGVGNKEKFSAAGAARQVLEQVEVNMCKEALLRALGQYMVHSLRLPALGQQQSIGHPSAVRSSPGASSSSVTSVALCDLEEALVPYYASASKQDYHCRLFI